MCTSASCGESSSVRCPSGASSTRRSVSGTDSVQNVHTVFTTARRTNNRLPRATGNPGERQKNDERTTMRNVLLAGAILVACAFGVAACGGDDSSSSSSSVGGNLNGAGATFPAPVYHEWAAKLKDKQGTTVNYNAIGSGGGIAQYTAGTVDFGASDSPMKPEERTAAEAKNGPSLQIPTVLGAITVS